MDEELTRHELARLEAQRKLQRLPSEILETAWVREAQIEAVIDAALAFAMGGDVGALERARQTGEWSARIAAQLGYPGDIADIRRAGVLQEVDPLVLARIPELAHLPALAENARVGQILGVADEFVCGLAAQGECAVNPRVVLGKMREKASPSILPVVEALGTALMRPSQRTAQAG